VVYSKNLGRYHLRCPPRYGGKNGSAMERKRRQSANKQSEGMRVCPPPLYKSRVVGKGLGMVKKMGKFPLKWTVEGIN